jgi:Protein of unknown function (DUF2845)
MKPLPVLRASRFLPVAALLLWACCMPAQAESLRCAGGIAAEGDSRLSVIYKCGQPVLRDSYCAPVYLNGNPNPVPEPFASALAPCLLTEELLYDRGEGNLMATVRIRSGVIQSITYGRTPR